MSGRDALEIGNWKLMYWVVGLALATASALLRFWALSQTPFANGWDSYFYLVQLKSLSETGRMHSPEASLFYPYLRLFYWFSGDYVAALKAGTAVLSGAFTGMVFWALSPAGGSSGGSINKNDSPVPVWSLPAAAFTLFSPQLTYFAAQYPKNLLGLVLLVAFAGSLFRMEQGGRLKTPEAWILPAILLIVNYFGHRLSFALAVVFAAFWYVFQFKPSALFSLKRLLAAGTAIALFVAAGYFFRGSFSLADLGRFSGVFSPEPQFAPWSFVSNFGRDRISGWWLAEIAVTTLCWLPAAGFLLRKTGNAQTAGFRALFCLSAMMLFPFLEWSFTGIAYRFFLVFVLVTPLMVIVLPQDKIKLSGVIFVALIVSSFFSWRSYNPKLHDPDYAVFAKVTASAQQFLSDKSPELVIAPNALAECFTFTTGTDAMPWLPEYEVDSSGLWRIAAGINLQTLRYYAEPADGKRMRTLGWRHCLLPESVWQRAIGKAKAENDTVFLEDVRLWRNPSQIRPGWLLHRKRKF